MENFKNKNLFSLKPCNIDRLPSLSSPFLSSPSPKQHILISNRDISNRKQVPTLVTFSTLRTRDVLRSQFN